MDENGDDTEPETYGYRSHVSWGQWIGLGLMGVLALLFMAGTLYSWFAHGYFDATQATFALIFGLQALGGFALFRALATSEVRFTDEGLAYANFKKEGVIPYEDLEDVRGRYIPYIGGWLTLRAPQTTLRMTVVLDDIGEFTHRLHDRLQRLDDPPFDRDNLFRFYKTAVYADASWDHLYNSWGRLLLTTMATGAMTTQTIWLKPDLWHGNVLMGIAIVALIGLSLPWMVLGILDIIFTSRWIADHADPEAFEIPELTEETREELLGNTIIGMVTVVALADLALLFLY